MIRAKGILPRHRPLDLANLAISDNQKTSFRPSPGYNGKERDLPQTPLNGYLGEMTYRVSIFFLFLCAVVWCQAGGQKTKGHVVSFHIEGDQTDNPKFNTPIKLGAENRQYYFSSVPTFTDPDIAWFYPFTAADGVSYGAAFRFKEYAAAELKGISLTNQGKLLGIRCSTAPLQAVLIDRPIDDGVVVIWSGLSQANLEEFQKKFPHVDDFTPKNIPQFRKAGG